MRAAFLLLLACAGGATAEERTAPGRFATHAARIAPLADATPAQPAASRFALSGRLAMPGAEAAGARFAAKAALKVANATCGPVGDLVFRNGFEGG
jgi:hypothetical protein